MPKDWQELTKLTRGASIAVERVRMVDSGIKIEGDFELPALARLSAEDQVFVMAFIRCDGCHAAASDSCQGGGCARCACARAPTCTDCGLPRKRPPGSRAG